MHAETWHLLGVVALQRGRAEEAVECLRRAVSLQADSAEFFSNLGEAYRALHRMTEAEQSYRQALAIDPAFVPAQNNLGVLLDAQGRVEEAAECFQRTLELRPEDPLLHNNLGHLLVKQGKLAEGLSQIDEALRIKSDYFEAHLNRGMVLYEQARIDEAAASYRQAMTLQPDSADAHSRLLFISNYDPAIPARELFIEHKRWDEQYTKRIARQWFYDNDRDPNRPLRVGYVSPDFRLSPLARFIEPILTHHDPKAVETYCYSDVVTPDQVTSRSQSLARQWRATSHLNDDQLAQQIHSDRIDILVDLAGHGARNRLLVFARKPAPVQVSYLGYPNTTGLKAIDHRLTDAVADPPNEPSFWTEDLVRLSGSMSCFQPPVDVPDVSPLPARRVGRLTFGSLHNLARLNPKVLDLWCRVLQAVPRARMLIGRHTLSGDTKNYFERQLIDRQIGHRVRLQQIELVGESHLATYQHIDISLDTFPWSGHTTACESLWMGVPMLTLSGDRHAGRLVASTLTSLGLTDWIARTPDEFVNLAVRMSQDFIRLSELRSRLRGRMQQSPLCDGPRFVQGLEAAYRRMWRSWCGRVS
jgi:predicted O-linked N-acetylglucosamine transferase (SPINDLY family)